MIRPATAKDIPALVEMGRRFHEKSSFNGVLSFDEGAFEQTVRTFIDGEGSYILVVDQEGEAHGMCGVVLYPMWFNHKERIAQEIFWWVEPDYRGKEADTLRETVEAVARKNGAILMIMLALEGLRDEALSRYYRKAGYAGLEHSYMKVL